MPVRFTQFKSDVHGGILGSGGCVSVIEFRHLSILEVGCGWWKTYLLTIRHPNIGSTKVIRFHRDLL